MHVRWRVWEFLKCLSLWYLSVNFYGCFFEIIILSFTVSWSPLSSFRFIGSSLYLFNAKKKVSLMDIGMIFELVRFSTKFGNNFTTWIFWTIDFLNNLRKYRKGCLFVQVFKTKVFTMPFNSGVVEIVLIPNIDYIDLFCLLPPPPQKKKLF